MKIDEKEIRLAMDRRMSALEASALRRSAIRRRIAEEPAVKRKMTVSAAIVLALIVAMTGAALAVGLSNLFEHFGQNDGRLKAIAGQAVPATQEPGTVKTEKLGSTVGTIHNAYYDGQTLLVAYSLENARRIEAYMPTEEQMKNADMERVGYIPEAQTEAEAHIIGRFAAGVQAGEPCGLAIYTVYAADHSYADGVDPGPAIELDNDGPEGMRYLLREYETPLPEPIRNRDRLTIEIPLREHAAYLWFDGEATWVIRETPKNAGSMSATVERTEAASLVFSGAGRYGNQDVQAQATLSAVRGELVLTGAGAFPKPEEGGYEFRICDENGSPYRISTACVNYPDTAGISFSGNGALPERLWVTICIDRGHRAGLQPVSEPIELNLSK